MSGLHFRGCQGDHVENVPGFNPTLLTHFTDLGRVSTPFVLKPDADQKKKPGFGTDKTLDRLDFDQKTNCGFVTDALKCFSSATTASQD
ncbi:MAG: hypothetical protein R2875_04545 [Desulfobacterales bacterium]